ncbi:MAG: hypothetical protein ABIZ18_07390 [Caldimonas sp.]
MDDPKTSPVPSQPGHYGAGYGERRPTTTTEPPPSLETAHDAPAGLEPSDALDRSDDGASPSSTDDGSPVVFTADDVGLRPPDHTPTESAPESEKVGLIFERS